jgi:hypothetical protein
MYGCGCGGVVMWWCGGVRSGSFCVFRRDTGMVMYWCRDEKVR